LGESARDHRGERSGVILWRDHRERRVDSEWGSREIKERWGCALVRRTREIESNERERESVRVNEKREGY
jgi:hypothetical protein